MLGSSTSRFDISPGGIEANRDQLLILLHAVDGELAGGGGGSDRGRIVDKINHQSGQTQAENSGPPFLRYEKNAYRIEPSNHRIISHNYFVVSLYESI